MKLMNELKYQTVVICDWVGIQQHLSTDCEFIINAEQGLEVVEQTGMFYYKRT